MKKSLIIIFGVMLLATSTACSQQSKPETEVTDSGSTENIPEEIETDTKESNIYELSFEDGEKEIEAKNYKPSKEIKSAELSDYKIQIGDNTYTLPIKIGELLKDKNVKLDEYMLDSRYSPQESALLNFHYMNGHYSDGSQDNEFDCFVFNPFTEEKELADCYICSLHIPVEIQHTLDTCPFILPKGYKTSELELTEENAKTNNPIIKAYGNDCISNDEKITYQYLFPIGTKEDEMSGIVFTGSSGIAFTGVTCDYGIDIFEDNDNSVVSEKAMSLFK